MTIWRTFSRWESRENNSSPLGASGPPTRNLETSSSPTPIVNPMWIPRSALELEQALDLGDLEEHSRLDFKRELPAKGKSGDIAVDIAAMANDGGLIVYGVGEASDGRPATRHPIADLRRVRERIDQIVQHSIAGRLRILITPLPLEPGGDEGYLVVQIPPSPDAPHQVLRDRRFYGRGETGNRQLDAGEIDRLYARRVRWEVDTNRLLDDALSTMPRGLPLGEGTMVVVCRPVSGDSGLLARATEARSPSESPIAGIKNIITEVLHRFPEQWTPGFSQLQHWTPSPGGGYRSASHGSSESIRPGRYLAVRLDQDGAATLLCDRATEQHAEAGLLVCEGLIAARTLDLAWIVGALLDAAGYAGPVDVALHVGGLRSAVSWQVHGPPVGFGGGERHPYGEPTYRASRRFDAEELRRDPVSAAAAVILPLTRVSAGERWDPLASFREQRA